MKVAPDYGIFSNNPIDRIIMEVSLITKDGHKISRRVDSSMWWEILNNHSKSMMEIEDELIELLLRDCEVPEQREMEYQNPLWDLDFEGPFGNLMS